jgi:hypothetical protein
VELLVAMPFRLSRSSSHPTAGGQHHDGGQGPGSLADTGDSARRALIGAGLAAAGLTVASAARGLRSGDVG